MGQKKMIQIDKEIADRVKVNYPDLSWNAIVSLLLSKDSSKDLSKDHMASMYATKDDLKKSKDEVKMLKDNINKVLINLIDKNNLQR
tara:strand:+ start:704 stop:964 length:261 start_codon:yes stop_codon:yes gene_type:complete